MSLAPKKLFHGLLLFLTVALVSMAFFHAGARALESSAQLDECTKRINDFHVVLSSSTQVAPTLRNTIRSSIVYEFETTRKAMFPLDLSTQTCAQVMVKFGIALGKSLDNVASLTLSERRFIEDTLWISEEFYAPLSATATVLLSFEPTLDAPRTMIPTINLETCQQVALVQKHVAALTVDTNTPEDSQSRKKRYVTDIGKTLSDALQGNCFSQFGSGALLTPEEAINQTTASGTLMIGTEAIANQHASVVFTRPSALTIDIVTDVNGRFSITVPNAFAQAQGAFKLKLTSPNTNWKVVKAADTANSVSDLIALEVELPLSIDQGNVKLGEPINTTLSKQDVMFLLKNMSFLELFWAKSPYLPKRTRNTLVWNPDSTTKASFVDDLREPYVVFKTLSDLDLFSQALGGLFAYSYGYQTSIELNMKGYLNSLYPQGTKETTLSKKFAPYIKSLWTTWLSSSTPTHTMETGTGATVTESTPPFSDILIHMYRSEITQLAVLEIIKGYPDKTFQPDRTISRAELLKLLVETTGEAPTNTMRISFSDIASSEWYFAALNIAVNKSWVQGYPDKTFRPHQAVNRAEALKIILNVLGVPMTQDKNLLSFSDVSMNDWFYPYVHTAINLGVVSPSMQHEGSGFFPGSGLTRGEAAYIIFHVLETR